MINFCLCLKSINIKLPKPIVLLVTKGSDLLFTCSFELVKHMEPVDLFLGAIRQKNKRILEKLTNTALHIMREDLCLSAQMADNNFLEYLIKTFPAIEWYLVICFTNNESLFDYLPKGFITKKRNRNKDIETKIKLDNALYMAVWGGHLKLIKTLLRAGAYVSEEIHLVAYKFGHFDLIRYFEKGLEFMYCRKGLAVACEYKQNELVKKILCHMIPTEESLAACIMHENYECFELILESSMFDLNRCLFLACVHEQYFAILPLVKKGASNANRIKKWALANGKTNLLNYLNKIIN